MTGDLSERSPVDLCLHLAGERATGTLAMTGPRGEAVLVFADGQLAGSRPPEGRTSRLGERLVSAGRLDRPDLDALLADQANDSSAPALGQMLVDRGLATADAVRLFVQEQVLETLLDAISWFEGTWDFQPSPAPGPVPGGGLRIPVDRALMEVRRRAAERERIATVVTSPSAVPSTTGRDGGELTTDALTVLAAVDGQRSVGDIARTLGGSYDETARHLYRLVLQERVEFADTMGTTTVTDATPEEAPLYASPLTATPAAPLADDGWADRRHVGATTAVEPEPWVGWANAARHEAPAETPPPAAAAPEAPAPPPPAAPTPEPATARASEPLWADTEPETPAPSATPAPPSPSPSAAAPASDVAPDGPGSRDLDADTRRALFSELHEVGRSHPGFAAPPEPESPAGAADAGPDAHVEPPGEVPDEVTTPDPAPSASLSRSDVSDLLRELHALNLDEG